MQVMKLLDYWALYLYHWDQKYFVIIFIFHNFETIIKYVHMI